MRKVKGAIFVAMAAFLIAATAKVVVVKIDAKNAAKIVPAELAKKYCSSFGYGDAECKSADLLGFSLDLDGNGAPETAIRHSKLSPGESSCVLYRDAKAKYAEIQRDFPCVIKPKETKTKNWLDIQGVVKQTDCEPLLCDFTWSGTSYKKGSCKPYEEGACEIE